MNDHRSDVVVTTNVSGQLEIDNLKPTETIMKNKKWITKTSFTVSAVEASTNGAVEINGKSIVHLEATTKELMSEKVLYIEGKISIY